MTKEEIIEGFKKDSLEVIFKIARHKGNSLERFIDFEHYIKKAASSIDIKLLNLNEDEVKDAELMKSAIIGFNPNSGSSSLGQKLEDAHALINGLISLYLYAIHTH